MLGSALRRGATIASRNLSYSLTNTASIKFTSSIASSRLAFAAPSLRRTFVNTCVSKNAYAPQERQYESDDAPDNVQVLPGADDAAATRFVELEERKLVHPSLLRAVIGDMKLTDMTPVQSETLNAALTGRDV